MDEKREMGHRPGPGAEVTVTVDLMVYGEVIASGERLTCLWVSGDREQRATVRRESDGQVIPGVPVSALTWWRRR